jgi:formylglycine-generating enzyme required for sulfatase activity
MPDWLAITSGRGRLRFGGSPGSAFKMKILMRHSDQRPFKKPIAEKADKNRYPQRGSVSDVEMVVVPRGSFMMGTPADEPYRIKGEDPVHKVTIAKPFAVGRFTISFDEWDACLADDGCNGVKGDDRVFGRGRLPAHGINFESAKSYLAWLSRKVSRTYRLPSESEREYYPRPGSERPSPRRTPITTHSTVIQAAVWHRQQGTEGRHLASSSPLEIRSPIPMVRARRIGDSKGHAALPGPRHGPAARAMQPAAARRRRDSRWRGG